MKVDKIIFEDKSLKGKSSLFKFAPWLKKFLMQNVMAKIVTRLCLLGKVKLCQEHLPLLLQF